MTTRHWVYTSGSAIWTAEEEAALERAEAQKQKADAARALALAHKRAHPDCCEDEAPISLLDGSSDARAMVEPSGQHRMRAHSEQQSRRQQRQHNVSV